MPEANPAPDATDWFVAVGLALTGASLPAPVDAAPVQPAAIAGWLAGLGWTPDRLAEHRHACRDDNRPWPHPVPVTLLGAGTAARLHALVAEVRGLTGTSGLVATQRPGQRVLTADDRRLLADVPPHHGNV